MKLSPLIRAQDLGVIMHLTSLVAAAASNTSFSVPTWVLWGIGIAAAVTFGLTAVVSLIAIGITTMTCGFLGGDEPWKQFGAIFKAFLIYGLPSGLLCSFVWANVNPWLGMAGGVGTFGIIWYAYAKIEKNRRRY